MYLEAAEASPILIQFIPFGSSVINLSIGLGDPPRAISQTWPSSTLFHPLCVSSNITQLPQKRGHLRFCRVSLFDQITQSSDLCRDLDGFGFFAQIDVAGDVQVEVMRGDLVGCDDLRQP